MSRRVVYLPEVSRDFVEAFAYYEALSPQAALRFEEAFGRAELEIELGLRTHQRVFDRYHRVFVGNFPYILYYRLDGAWVVIVAVLYARFSTERISRTLRERKG
jgi:plasmid stabilization system protein ParE